ncbi:unnamed protein product, partial [Cladocopium goreaui]
FSHPPLPGWRYGICGLPGLAERVPAICGRFSTTASNHRRHCDAASGALHLRALLGCCWWLAMAAAARHSHDGATGQDGRND